MEGTAILLAILKVLEAQHKVSEEQLAALLRIEKLLELPAPKKIAVTYERIENT